LSQLRIERLAGHDRSQFSSGDTALDTWFHKRASQDDERDVARVFVAVDDLGVSGFYTLSTFAVTAGDLPERLAKKLPRYPQIPTTLTGRLARDIRVKGQGVGELLLADAVKRAVQVTREVASYAIIVEAKNANASNFYGIFGFIPFASQPHRMFLPVATALLAMRR
jgi:GNAT superfamily N-acetyltransferase